MVATHRHRYSHVESGSSVCSKEVIRRVGLETTALKYCWSLFPPFVSFHMCALLLGCSCATFMNVYDVCGSILVLGYFVSCGTVLVQIIIRKTEFL